MHADREADVREAQSQHDGASGGGGGDDAVAHCKVCERIKRVRVGDRETRSHNRSHLRTLPASAFTVAASRGRYRVSCRVAFIDSRLSCFCLPLQMPSRTLARPSLKYILSGTSVRPFSKAWSANLLHLAAVHEQLAAALGLVVEARARRCTRRCSRRRARLRPFDAAVGFVEREPAGAEALHFAADEHDAAFERIEHRVVVPGLAVVGDDALVLVVGFGLAWLFRLSALAGLFRVVRWFRHVIIILAWDYVNKWHAESEMGRGISLYPKGIESFSPGLRRSRYPGKIKYVAYNSERVASHLRCTM